MDDKAQKWDTGSHEGFYAYYGQQSHSLATFERFKATRDTLLHLKSRQHDTSSLDILDIGCGAGTRGGLWSEAGHRYVGIDIHEPLITRARNRAAKHGLNPRYEVGSATELPTPDASFGVCVMPELLEQALPRENGLREAIRCLRHSVLIYTSTNNTLSPIQQEFNLQLYSWYPKALERYFELRAVTDWPELVNYAKYPGISWISFYALRYYLRDRGFDAFDRFDLADDNDISGLEKLAFNSIKALPPLRLLAHMATSYTVLVAQKQLNT